MLRCNSFARIAPTYCSIFRPKPTPYDSLVNKAATLLKRYDLDSDGRISFNEFVVLVKDDLKTQARGSE